MPDTRPDLPYPRDAQAHRAEAPELVALVQIRFRDAPYAAIRRLTCEFHDCTLTIRGQVPTYFQKQIAQNLAHSCLDAMTILDNAIEVSS